MDGLVLFFQTIGVFVNSLKTFFYKNGLGRLCKIKSDRISFLKRFTGSDTKFFLIGTAKP